MDRFLDEEPTASRIPEKKEGEESGLERKHPDKQMSRCRGKVISLCECLSSSFFDHTARLTYIRARGSRGPALYSNFPCPEKACCLLGHHGR